jgi:hypothetical protein
MYRLRYFVKWLKYTYAWNQHHRKIRIAQRKKRLEEMRIKLEAQEAEKRRLHEAMIREEREAKGLPVAPPTSKQSGKLNFAM